MKNEKGRHFSNAGTYGAACGALAYTLWGLLAIYWKLLGSVPAFEILAHRIVWSFMFTVILVVLKRKSGKLKNVFTNRTNMKNIAICAVMISINWFIYIWAVNSNHVVDASMGYFINPFVSVILGIMVLNEKIDRFQQAAMVVACIGVLLKIVMLGKIPWISLALAFSFGFYGLFKKKVTVESTIGMMLETMLLAPLAFLYLVVLGINGNGSIGGSIGVTLLLVLTGVATATPLLLFSEAAKNVRLATIGFLQYISPSISLFLGVFVFKEHFGIMDLASFGLIWAGLMIYSFSVVKIGKKQGIERNGDLC